MASNPKPVLLSGGNPQIAKADGDAPVQAYIAAMPGWKRDVGRRLDALIVRTVPNVRKAVKWNSPFYGIEGQGWFLGFHTFTHYVKVAFFRGTSLRPVPPGEQARGRALHRHPRGRQLDEAQMATWVKQAAAIARLGQGLTQCGCFWQERPGRSAGASSPNSWPPDMRSLQRPTGRRTSNC